ncbi:hypothetical protein KDC22_31505 [Paenibacillus tritici]|uniref:hypothetical protein n=1 Tax=Paenibacillus tritici TaxID=1873425 RepID=UPI001BABAF4B|nr:hypothetical protein [Paenibacillus tritici]QUL54722.1 hypothetical protein KDC22_31505 [Paenibacillus tritici]
MEPATAQRERGRSITQSPAPQARGIVVALFSTFEWGTRLFVQTEEDGEPVGDNE